FRDEESNTVAQVLSNVFKGARPSNLLLFGKPGTGKTAVVRRVVDKLKAKAVEAEKDVKVPIVNAKVANSAYKGLFDIAQEIGTNTQQGEDKGKVVPFTGLSMGEATDRILQFIQKKTLRVILVIDEIDSLVDRNGNDVLYSFTRANQQMSKGGFV